MRLIAWLISVIILAVGVMYFLPNEWKMKAIEEITNVVPANLKEKTESLLLSPPEARAKLITTLEENLAELQTNPSATNAASIIQQSQAALAKLKEKNDELSLTEIVKTKLVERFIKASSTQCVSP